MVRRLLSHPALRCASVIDRDALVLAIRLFALKACERRGVRWAGDVQAVSLLRQWLATGLEAAAAGGAGSGGGGGGEMLRVRAASQVPLGLTISSANVLAAEPALACLVFSFLPNARDRCALARVGRVFRDADAQVASLPAAFATAT